MVGSFCVGVCGELETDGKLGLQDDMSGGQFPDGSDGGVRGEVRNVGKRDGLKEKAIAAVIEV